MPSEKVGVLADKRRDLRTIFGRIAEDGLARNLGIALGFGHSSVLVYFLLGRRAHRLGSGRTFDRSGNLTFNGPSASGSTLERRCDSSADATDQLLDRARVACSLRGFHARPQATSRRTIVGRESISCVIVPICAPSTCRTVTSCIGAR
jgi:hypothetical protein